MAANKPTLYELIYLPHRPSPPSNSSLSLQERCYSYTPISSLKSSPFKKNKSLQNYISEHVNNPSSDHLDTNSESHWSDTDPTTKSLDINDNYELKIRTMKDDLAVLLQSNIKIHMN